MLSREKILLNTFYLAPLFLPLPFMLHSLKQFFSCILSILLQSPQFSLQEAGTEKDARSDFTGYYKPWSIFFSFFLSFSSPQHHLFIFDPKISGRGNEAPRLDLWVYALRPSRHLCSIFPWMGIFSTSDWSLKHVGEKLDWWKEWITSSYFDDQTNAAGLCILL